MQHTDTQFPGPFEEELLTAVLQAAPVEKRLEGLSPEEVLRRYTPTVYPEELAAGLTEEQAARLRELLDRKKG